MEDIALSYNAILRLYCTRFGETFNATAVYLSDAQHRAAQLMVAALKGDRGPITDEDLT